MRKAPIPVWLICLLLLGCSSEDDSQPTRTVSRDAAAPPAAEPDAHSPESRTAPEPEEQGPLIPKTPPGTLPGGLRKSKWDPPPDLEHLDSTPAESRKMIDGLIDILFDPRAGPARLEAKKQLTALGKAAFPRILGRMAKVRDELTDVDSVEERVLESSLKLADETLRGMDGWLEARGKASVRPGSKRDYVQYILRLHYKRWEQVLKHMDKMPGPFDPTADILDPMAKAEVIRVFLDHCELKQRVGGDDWLTDPDVLVALMFHWIELNRKTPSQWPLDLLSRLPKALKARFSIGDLSGDETRRWTAWRLTRKLTESNFVHLRKAADDCLRALYDCSVSYDPTAPLSEREKKSLMWIRVIERTGPLPPRLK